MTQMNGGSVYSLPSNPYLQQFDPQNSRQTLQAVQYQDITDTGEVRLSNPLPTLFQSVKVVGGQPPVQMVHYYFSKLTFRQIMKELQDGTQNRYSDLRLNELLRRSIMEMNK